MKKQEFITKLHYKLSSLPEKDVLERLGFISEMIDDRMEEGYTEEDAIRALGPIDDLAARIITEVGASPKAVSSAEAAPKKKISALAIILIALGSPIWISLAAAAFSLLVATYAVLWSLAGSLWAVFGALVGAGAGGFLASFILATSSLSGGVLLGASLFSLGLSVPAFYACLWATKGAAWLSGQIAVGIKDIFTRR